MASRVFVAGATGAIGRPLVAQLLRRGYEVFGTTRSRTAELERAGAHADVVDAFDHDAVVRAVAAAKPVAESGRHLDVSKAERELGWTAAQKA